jgi:hypothetical protein
VRHRAAPRGAGAVPLRLLLLRGGLAGAVICFAVLLAAAAGDGGVAAGVATAFPVIFLTIQVSLWLGHDGTGQDGQGKAVQGGAVGPMMLGSLAVVSMRRTRARRRLGGALEHAEGSMVAEGADRVVAAFAFGDQLAISPENLVELAPVEPDRLLRAGRKR